MYVPSVRSILSIGNAGATPLSPDPLLTFVFLHRTVHIFVSLLSLILKERKNLLQKYISPLSSHLRDDF